MTKWAGRSAVLGSIRRWSCRSSHTNRNPPAPRAGRCRRPARLAHAQHVRLAELAHHACARERARRDQVPTAAQLVAVHMQIPMYAMLAAMEVPERHPPDLAQLEDTAAEQPAM